MLVIPAIDLKDGRCVRLRQGDMAAETIYSDDVTEVAGRWQQKGAGLIHVVDLNGAVDGEPKNLPHIESIMKAVRVKVQVGGGIRTIETIPPILSMPGCHVSCSARRHSRTGYSSTWLARSSHSGSCLGSIAVIVDPR